MTAKREKRSSLSVGFILVPEFTLIAFSGFLEVLRQAADEGDRSRQVHCTWTVMSRDLTPVTSSSGVQIVPWELFKEPRSFDYIVIVGGLLPKNNSYDTVILNYLKKADLQGVNLVGLCTGSFYMAAAALMKGRKACVHWYHFQDFIEAFPESAPVTDELFIIDRNKLTCPGGSSVVDLALWIIEKHLGKERVIKCLRHLLLDWGRPHNHPQTPFIKDYSSISDPRVRKALFFMEQNLSRSLTLDDIALHINTGVRQMERLFKIHIEKSPLSCFRDIRLAYGKWLLRNTDKSVTEIAYECGFADSSHFSRWFKNRYDLTPAAIRRKQELTDGSADYETSASFHV